MTCQPPITGDRCSGLPTVIASSVIRSAHQGDSHGGVYLVNLNTDHVEQVLDWNDPSIDWGGRGMDRGLRGIAFYGEHVYIAASNEIFVYDRHFKRAKSITNAYLRHCHEIFVGESTLYLSSTGFDALLEYDLASERFVSGRCVRYPGVDLMLHCTGEERGKKCGRGIAKGLSGLRPRMWAFDPNGSLGPAPGDTMHINNIHVEEKKIYFAGTNMCCLFVIDDKGLSKYAALPFKTHNARPFNGGVLFNDTAGNKVTLHADSGNGSSSNLSFPVKQYDSSSLAHTNLPQDHARQAFGRGLCLLGDDLLAAGSSPATISVHCLATGKTVKSVNLTMDVRNSIHGLEVWPFD